MKKMLRKATIATLAVAMLAGGTTTALADSKGKGNDKRDDWKIESKGNDNKNSGNFKIEAKGNVNIVLNFNDMQGGDVEWAIRHIASLASKRVFQGYEDGSFKPRNNISRIEAITAAVRLMGLESQAEAKMDTQLNFKDADKVKKDYGWAVGYVAVAIENDLFSEAEMSVQPDKAADRLWATTLLVKAMKLDAEAKAKMNTKLSFKDADQIPAGSVGYVAVAVEKGLVEGFENNTFRPNMPVTRAQLAALLDRTGEQLPDKEQNVMTGTVSAAVNNNVLTVTNAGTATPIVLYPNAFVFRNGVMATLADIKVGDQVRVKLFNNIGVYVEVTKASTTAPAVDFTVNGRLFALDWNEGKISKVTVNTAVYGATTPTLSTYSVDPNYTIIGNAAMLVFDRSIELKGTNQIVKSIEVK